MIPDGPRSCDFSRHFLLSLGPAVVAIVLDRAANRRMRAEPFARCVHLGLVGIGVLLLVQSV